MLFNYEFLFFLIISIYYYQIISSNIYPIYNFIITTDLNHRNITKDYFYLTFNTKGVGLIFDYNSEINLIPYHLFIRIKNNMAFLIPDSYSFIKDKENGYQELLFYGYMDNKISFHIITQSIGITFPNDVLFPIDEYYFGKFTFSFLSKENQENIIIGKYLIDLMKIEFNEKGELIINNKNFSTLIED